MRPTPDEIIGGVRKLLKEEIAPCVSKDATPQLRRILSVLRDFRWNDAVFDLLHENATLLRCVEKIAAKFQGYPGISDAMIRSLRDECIQSAPRSFSEANAINGNLRRLLCSSIETIRALPRGPLDELCGEIAVMVMELQNSSQSGPREV